MKKKAAVCVWSVCRPAFAFRRKTKTFLRFSHAPPEWDQRWRRGVFSIHSLLSLVEALNLECKPFVNERKRPNLMVLLSAPVSISALQLQTFHYSHSFRTSIVVKGLKFVLGTFVLLLSILSWPMSSSSRPRAISTKIQ